MAVKCPFYGWFIQFMILIALHCIVFIKLFFNSFISYLFPCYCLFLSATGWLTNKNLLIFLSWVVWSFLFAHDVSLFSLLPFLNVTTSYLISYSHMWYLLVPPPTVPDTIVVAGFLLVHKIFHCYLSCYS